MKRSLHPVGRTCREAASESTVIEERQFNRSGTLAALTRLTWGADLSGNMQGAGGVGGLLMAEEMDLADINPPTAHYYWYDGTQGDWREPRETARSAARKGETSAGRERVNCPGNVTGITDDSGAIEGTFRYTSFGALAETATTTAFAENQPWTQADWREARETNRRFARKGETSEGRERVNFSTKYHDTEVEPVAGTYYYGYRHYMPSVGRWPSRDPIDMKGGINLFVFVDNSPTVYTDTLGLTKTCDDILIRLYGTLQKQTGPLSLGEFRR